MVTVNAIMQVRRDTAANFASENAVYAEGEILFETDTRKIKVGDGVTAYSGLGFSTVDMAGVFRSYSDLTADTSLTYTSGLAGSVAAGDYVMVSEGRMEVAASGASDHHATTAGGVKLYEAGPNFSTRARAAAAWARMVAASETVADGTIWSWPGASIVYDGSATALSDFAGWYPRLPLRLEAWAENTNPGVTDMTAALQSAVEYAASLHSTVGFSVPVDLGGVSVGISDQGAYGIDVRDLVGVKIQNGELKAIGTWTGTTPLIYAGANATRTEGFAVENVHFECDHKAAGILFDNTIDCAVVDVVMSHIAGYGVRTQTKSGQLRIARTTIRQYVWGETGFDDQANRTAIGFDMNTADWILESCIAYLCAIPFYKGVGTNWQMDSCHFYNDGLTTITDADAIYNCKIDDPRGGQITNLYTDKGVIYINCDYLAGSGSDHLYIDGVTGVSGGQNTKDFILYTEVAGNNLGGLTLSNINLPIRATNFDFQTGGSGSYSSNLRWSFIGVKQKDGTKASGVADMFNMNGQFITDGSGNFYFGGFQDVVLGSERKITLMADYDANSGSGDSVVQFGTDGTVYTQQISSGRWDFGVGQATGGGPIVELGWSGDSFLLTPTNASGGIDYTKQFKFDQPAGVWAAETPFKVLTTTVASLPAAGTAGAGARAVVTDATATTFASTVTGGGANTVPVYSDGTNWLIG